MEVMNNISRFMFWRLGVECILQVLSHGIFACLWNSISLRCFFVAAGRAPNSKRLNLEAVGVELDNTGAIKVHISLFQSLDSMKSNKKKLFSFQHLDDRWIHCDSIILDCGIHSWLYRYKHRLFSIGIPTCKCQILVIMLIGVPSYWRALEKL